MSDKTIQVKIISAERQLFTGEARCVIAPASQGEVGIFPQHAPFLSLLKHGTVRVCLPTQEEHFFYVASGLIEVLPFCVTILADIAVPAAELDEERVQRAKQQAEELLHKKDRDFNYALVAAELAQAVAQLRTIQKARDNANRC